MGREMVQCRMGWRGFCKQARCRAECCCPSTELYTAMRSHTTADRASQFKEQKEERWKHGQQNWMSGHIEPAVSWKKEERCEVSVSLLHGMRVLILKRDDRRKRRKKRGRMCTAVLPRLVT